MVLNLIACVLMVLQIALRFFYLATQGGETNNPAFFVVLAFYQLVFIALLVAAEFKKERPRLYFDFLDNKFGRGGTIIFTQLLIIESGKAVIIILGLVVLAIGLISVVAGWTQGPDGINSGAKTTESSNPSPNKADREPAAPSSAPQNAHGMLPPGAIELGALG
jgi:hypothetical protein